MRNRTIRIYLPKWRECISKQANLLDSTCTHVGSQTKHVFHELLFAQVDMNDKRNYQGTKSFPYNMWRSSHGLLLNICSIIKDLKDIKKSIYESYDGAMNE